MQKRLKHQVASILKRYAKRLLTKYQPKIIVVTGSVGKTSTKLAIAHVLKSKYRVLADPRSYNTDIGLPLALFGLDTPHKLSSVSQWARIFKSMRNTIKRGYPYDVVVLELGTDAPGDLARFKSYIKPDIAVVTAIAAEHMEFFKTIDAVAKEELTMVDSAKRALLSADVASKYADQYVERKDLAWYDNKEGQEYSFTKQGFDMKKGFWGQLDLGNVKINVQLKLLGVHSIKAAVAAAAVAEMMGVGPAVIQNQLKSLRAVEGRMNLLKGKNRSSIIDDTYNASPTAVIAALETLYSLPSTGKKIVILGSMNELGAHSKRAHQEVGRVCDSKQIKLVATIGKDAATYLAPTARHQGCRVEIFDSPYAAGEYVLKHLSAGDLVLAKGSQNGVFAEEAVALLLANDSDRKKLVRQAKKWQDIKSIQFSTEV